MFCNKSIIRQFRNRLVKTKAYSTLADIFRDSGSAKFLAAAGSSSSIPQLHGLPEVIVTGRANVGKSTLLNGVLGRRSLLHTSKKAGRTRELNFYQVGVDPGKLIVVDAPGYGARGKREWGTLFDEYITTRQKLRRIYILFSAKHQLNVVDRGMLEHLSNLILAPNGTQRFTLQSVITKVDCVAEDELEETFKTMQKDILKTAPLCFPPLITSAEMSPPFGINEVRKNIAEACGLL